MKRKPRFGTIGHDPGQQLFLLILCTTQFRFLTPCSRDMPQQIMRRFSRCLADVDTSVQPAQPLTSAAYYLRGYLRGLMFERSDDALEDVCRGITHDLRSIDAACSSIDAACSRGSRRVGLLDYFRKASVPAKACSLGAPHPRTTNPIAILNVQASRDSFLFRVQYACGRP